MLKLLQILIDNNHGLLNMSLKDSVSWTIGSFSEGYPTCNHFHKISPESTCMLKMYCFQSYTVQSYTEAQQNPQPEGTLCPGRYIQSMKHRATGKLTPERNPSDQSCCVSLYAQARLSCLLLSHGPRWLAEHAYPAVHICLLRQGSIFQSLLPAWFLRKQNLSPVPAAAAQTPQFTTLPPSSSFFTKNTVNTKPNALQCKLPLLVVQADIYFSG